jgi:cysteine synthase B
MRRMLDLSRAIGRTPLVELASLAPSPRVRILAKLEGANPGGSVKDRPALYMLEAARRSGALRPGQTVLEPTSGNTGIALAMLCAARGLPITLTMPACVSEERRAVLAALGAEVLLTPAEEGTDGAIRVGRALAREHPDRYFMPDQYANPANVLAHYETTGPEIWGQTDGTVDVFVAGMGTSGTLMGVSSFLHEKKPGVRVVGVEPRLGHRVQGLKNMKEAIVPPIYDPARLDAKRTVEDEEAFEMARALARREGLFVGMSSGAAAAGALAVARELEEGTVVVLLPDRGDRYLSTNLFRSVCGRCPP